MSDQPIQKTNDSQPAHWGRRFLARFIDNLISIPGYLLFIIPGILLFGFRDSLLKNGRSIGRSAMDQCLVDIDTNDIPSHRKRFARNFTSWLLCGVSYGIYAVAEMIVSLARKDGRCVTDLMFGTIVIEDPKNGLGIGAISYE